MGLGKPPGRGATMTPTPAPTFVRGRKFSRVHPETIKHKFPPLPIQSLPIRLLGGTSLSAIHLIFVTMKLQVAFVVDDEGYLIGRIDRTTVANADKILGDTTIKQHCRNACPSIYEKKNQ